MRDQLADQLALGIVIRAFPPELVDSVVDEVGVRERRARMLPAPAMVYFVIAMALFRQLTYSELWQLVLDALGPNGRALPRTAPSTAAIAKARTRLGWLVMATLAERAAPARLAPACYRGLRLIGVDAIAVTVPYSVANRSEFGCRATDAGLAPQVRVVGVGERLGPLIGAHTGRIDEPEPMVVRRLHRLLGPGMLLVAEELICPATEIARIRATGAHALVRMLGEPLARPGRMLSDGSRLTTIAATDRRGVAGRVADPEVVRVIEAPLMSGRCAEPRSFVTTLLDPRHLAAADVPGLYAHRWRIAPVLTLRTATGATSMLRSRVPVLVRQELYGILCAHQAIRDLVPAGSPAAPLS